jgi:hypothetical protein
MFIVLTLIFVENNYYVLRKYLYVWSKALYKNEQMVDLKDKYHRSFIVSIYCT